MDDTKELDLDRKAADDEFQVSSCITRKPQRVLAAFVLAPLHECPHKASGLHRKIIIIIVAE